MNELSVTNTHRNRSLGERVRLADRWWSRLRGLLGSAPLETGEGLLLVPCQSVHMFGMRFPLDVAFLDRQQCVVALYPDLAPGGRTRWHREARSALELPAGTLEATATRVGDVLVCSPSPAARKDSLVSSA